MILVIDNYDSFVHNLARLIRLTGVETEIIRNDYYSVQELIENSPRGIVLSPGPATPRKAGICLDLIKAAPAIPILGICLGHQAIGEAYGGVIRQAITPLHGQASEVFHDGTGILRGVPSPLKVGRYHSLVTVFENPQDIIVQSRTAEGDIMAVRHQLYPHFGIQWHPESILTQAGERLISNFTALCQEYVYDMA